MRAAECVPLRASQDRSLGPVRFSPPSWPLSTPTLQAAHGDVRLVGVVRRSEERGHDARAMGHMCDPRRFSRLCGVACSGRAAYDGSSASYVRFICFVVHAVQKIVCAEPIGHLHFHHYFLRTVFTVAQPAVGVVRLARSRVAASANARKAVFLPFALRHTWGTARADLE